MQSIKSILVVEQKNSMTKIVNAYIFYDVDNWSRNLLKNFVLKASLFGPTKILKNNDKSKYVYSCYGKAFDGASSWSFGDDVARNAVIFGFDNSSSFHSDNRKNNYSMAGLV